MLENSRDHKAPQIICCDPEPDSRRRLTEKLTSFGYPVLATGNPQIAAGLLQEGPAGALVIVMDRVKLTMVSVLVEARRSRPELPIVLILNEGGRSQIPPGLADVVLIDPTDGKLREAVKAFVGVRSSLLTAC